MLVKKSAAIYLFSSNLDRIMWSQSRSAYFQGKIKGFILTSDMLEVLNGASASIGFQDNPMKTNQNECAVCIKATHRDLNLEFDTTELATAWSNALKYVLSLKESPLNEDEKVSSTSSVNSDLSTIAESDGHGSASSFSSISSSSQSLKSSLIRTSSSPTLNSEVSKRSVRKGFSMKSVGSFMKMKSGASFDSKSGSSGSRNSNRMTIKGIFKSRNTSNSIRLDNSFARTNSDLSSIDISNIEEADEYTGLTPDEKSKTSALVEKNEKCSAEIKRLDKELGDAVQKLEVANSCIENLTKSLNAIMRSQFSGDVQKDLPTVPESLEERFSTDEWSSNIDRFINKIANNNHLSRSVSNRSILLSGKDKDALEHIRKMLVGQLKSSREYSNAMLDVDPIDSKDIHFDDIEAEIIEDRTDNHLDVKSTMGEKASAPMTKLSKGRKDSVKYVFNSDNVVSNDNESKRHRKVSILLSSAIIDE